MNVRMTIALAGLALFLGVAGVSPACAEVLQVPARGRFYLARGWSLAYWGLEAGRRGVHLQLEAERSPCAPERGACLVTRNLPLPPRVRQEGDAVTMTDSQGRRHVLAVRASGSEPFELRPGVDVRWDRGGTFLLVDTDVSLPSL